MYDFVKHINELAAIISNMIEKLLTTEELQEIVETAKRNQVLKNPNVLSFGNEKTSIYKLSPINGIIFIKGDEHTGFNHINERHSYWSDNYYWKEENDKIKLDDPSKFSSKSLPIIDYVKIADRLFLSKNLNIEKNKRPDIFEMYSGIVEDENNGTAKYHMLLYKGTRVIHTLYPHNKSNNRKKHINFRKGNPQGKLWLNPLLYTIAVPYHDEKDRVKYSFQLTKTYESKIEKAILINHKFETWVSLFERTFEKFNYDDDLFSIKYADLSSAEKLISRLELDEENNSR